MEYKENCLFFNSAHLMPELLENAIMTNNYFYVEQGLNQFDPVPANSVNEALQTGLMIACMHKSVETVKVFLKKSTLDKYNDPSFCDVNRKDILGWNAIHHAAKSGSLETVKLLIEHETRIDATTNKNETALFLATKHNRPHIIDFLAKNHSPLNTKAWCEKYENSSIEKKATALELAIDLNLEESAHCLLFHLNIRNIRNQKELNELLDKAAKKGYTKMSNELIVNGAYVHHQPGTLLKYIKKIVICCCY
jgi:ankyrin repeat protein